MIRPPSEYRERCLDEKGRECVVCGDGDDIVVHHIDGNRENNALSNLVPVCTTHHSQIHHSESDAVEKFRRQLADGDSLSGKTTMSVSKSVKEFLRLYKRDDETWDDILLRSISGLSSESEGGQRLTHAEVDDIAEVVSERAADKIEARMRFR